MEKFSSGIVKVNNADIYYEMKGKGETLILIHGLPVDSRMWDLQFEQLSQHFRVLRFDLPGYGKSGVHHNDFSLIEDIKGLLDLFKISCASFLGLSVGGRLSIDFALQHPEMVKNLIVAATGLSGWNEISEERKEFNAKLNQCYQEGNKEKAIKLMCEGWIAGPFRKIEEINTDICMKFSGMILNSYSKEPGKGKMIFPEINSIDLIHQINAKTLIITSKFDFPEFELIANHLHSKIKNSIIKEISGAGHMISMEEPEKFNEAVINFLQSSTS